MASLLGRCQRDVNQRAHKNMHCGYFMKPYCKLCLLMCPLHRWQDMPELFLFARAVSKVTRRDIKRQNRCTRDWQGSRKCGRPVYLGIGRLMRTVLQFISNVLCWVGEHCIFHLWGYAGCNQCRVPPLGGRSTPAVQLLNARHWWLTTCALWKHLCLYIIRLILR